MSAILWGIFLWNFFEDTILISIVAIVFLLVVFILFRHIHRICIVLFCLVFWVVIGAGSSIYHGKIIDINISILDRYEWQKNTYIWTISDVYKRSDFHDDYLVKVRQINHLSIKSDMHAIIRVPKNFSLHPGQEISFEWKMYFLEDFWEFSYKKYMYSRSIYFKTNVSNIGHISESKNMLYYLYDNRQKLLERISRIYPKNEAIFLGGILLWARENLPNDLKEDFNNSWLTHYIAVSGFNITLCVIFITFLFGFLSTYLRIICVFICVTLFTVYVWPTPPVVRAAIMWILAYIFLQSWNKGDSFILVIFTAVCMTLFSPLSLNYDVSLHLSFLAVIGIIYTRDILLKAFSFLPEIFAIKEAFVMTLAALVFTLPIMIFQFWQISLLSPFANIAIAWSIPIAMLTWAVSIILDMIHPILWMISWFIAWVFLAYDIQMVRLFWNSQWALIHFDFWVYKPYLFTLYFVFMGYIVTLYHIKKEKQS